MYFNLSMPFLYAYSMKNEPDTIGLSSASRSHLFESSVKKVSFANVSLELFSGQATFSRLMKARGFKSYTLDFDKRHKADFCEDILLWNCPFVPGSVAAIWASPDCRLLSRNGSSFHWEKITIGYRRYKYVPKTDAACRSVAQVARTVDIIRRLDPVVWFIENPVGRIHHLECIKSLGHYRYGVNYKDWGFSYSKETYIFTNQLLPLPTKKVVRPGASVKDVRNRVKRASIPAALLSFLIDHSILNLKR
jgi:hypothetical protein